ncbi:hypothetical protein BJ170DRAFT_358644 [Xylariales sp. AK1849]|nr:hypothetical protein BJ170DRAFT_358644 [Xylariales sp. AK1849]
MSGTGEHVVLADCADSSGVLSSEMAYYSSSPDSSPGDIAGITTDNNQTAAWTCSTTNAVFTDTGVTFSAKIGPGVADGEYAGTASNGYDSKNGGFRCWQSSFLNLYRHGDMNCSMVYDCDHDKAPTSTTIASCTASATSTATTISPTAAANTGLATGAIIGISVGGGIALIIALVAACLVWRYLRANKRARKAKPPRITDPRTDKSRPKLPSMAQRPYADPGAWQGPPPVHELEEQWRPTEVPSLSHPPELDSSQRLELPTPESQYYEFYGHRSKSPVSP